MASETKTPFQRAIAELASAFETATRDGGGKYTRLRDGHPEWMRDAVYAAHEAIGGRLPSDWAYASCSAIVDTMTGYDADDADGMRDNEAEICDGLVDVYNADRVKWLADHLDNAALCDEAAEESGTGVVAMFDLIGQGQYLGLTRMFGALIDACDERATEIEASDE